MNISKIRIKMGGLKGMTVDYIKTESKEGFEYLNEHTSRYKRPVQGKLLTLIQTLQEALRELCSLESDADIEITGFNYSGDSFLITAKVTNLLGKVFAVNTPLTKEDEGYENYGKTAEVMDIVYKEVKAYVEVGGKINAKQFMMQFAEHDKKSSVTVEEVKVMEDNQAFDQMREILEKRGAIVITEKDNVQEEKIEEEESPFDKKEVKVKVEKHKMEKVA